MTIRHVLAHGALLALLTPALVIARVSETVTDTQLDYQAAAAPRAAQATGPDTLVAPFSDPSRPGLLRVNLVTGTIRVRAHQGKDVIIDTLRGEAGGSDRIDGQGMRRIRNTSAGLTVEEQRNEMSIFSSNPSRQITLDIQVPTQTSLVLSTVNSGDISVQGVVGDIEVNNTNGGVTMSGVSGAVVAHALNQDVVVSLVGVSGKPMSFSSLNGDINVTLPASVKANVRLQPGNGEVYSDFDIDMQPAVLRQEGGRTSGGKYVLRIEQTMVGKINGGGPEITCKTFNGNIRIRKGA
jgi:hypothetical protein